MRRFIAALCALLFVTAAYAQNFGTIPNHSVPVGRGAGVTGSGSVAPGSTGLPLVSNGASADPSFRGLPNSGFAAAPANTVKGAVSAGAVTDVPLPATTCANLGWTVGTGFACSGVVTIGAYGAKCDGTTNDTTAIQNAWNAAAALGQNLFLSGAGTSCLFSSITQPTPVQRNAGLLAPIASMLVGDGPNSVQMISTVTGTACAITLTNSFVSYQTASKMGGFALRQTSGANVGEGLCVTNATKLAISNVFVSGFDRGLQCIDCIGIHLSDSTFLRNNVHVYGARASNTNPNAWVVDSNIFAAAVQYAIELTHPDEINILSNTFEANGTNLGLSPATILINGLAIDGSFGANITGNYFENDAQVAIAILQLSGDANLTSFNIVGNSFVRNSSNETAMLTVINAAAAVTNVIMINLLGNNFFDTSPYVPGTNPYISLANPTIPSVIILCRGNTYKAAASMPTKCQLPGPATTFSMDANGVYGGP